MKYMQLSIQLCIIGFFFGPVLVDASSFRVVAFSQITSLTGLEYQSGDGIESVTISTSSFSVKYPIPPSGVIDFYKNVPLGEEEQVPLLEVNFGEESGDMILLLQADAQRLSYSYLLIEDTVEGFPMGSVMVMNFTSKSVFAKFGEERVKLESGSQEIVSLTGLKNLPFNGGVKFAVEFDGSGKVFSSSSWYLLPSMKIFCLIYSNPDGKPRIRRIRLT
ncbi:MAG: hypothetical protein ACJAU9_000531 [Lentimonas sp.]|jgi:hypothetical protein